MEAMGNGPCHLKVEGKRITVPSWPARGQHHAHYCSDAYLLSTVLFLHHKRDNDQFRVQSTNTLALNRCMLGVSTFITIGPHTFVLPESLAIHGRVVGACHLQASLPVRTSVHFCTSIEHLSSLSARHQ